MRPLLTTVMLLSRTCERRPARRSSEGDTKFDVANAGSNPQNGASRHIEKAGAIQFIKMKLPSQSFADATPGLYAPRPLRGLSSRSFSKLLSAILSPKLLMKTGAGPFYPCHCGALPPAYCVALIVSGLCGGEINPYNGFEFCRILLKQR